jgi:hypothetical protein
MPRLSTVVLRKSIAKIEQIGFFEKNGWDDEIHTLLFGKPQDSAKN